MPAWCADAYGCLGILTIDGIEFNGPAWDVPNPTRLWFGHAVQGDSITLPRIQGARSNPTRLAEVEHDLYFVINGGSDEAGVPFSDPWEGLETNLATLWAGALQPVGTGRGTREATLTTPSGATLTADIRTKPLQQIGDEIEDPMFAEFTLTIVVPGGRFS